jgi:hypothetical protein
MEKIFKSTFLIGFCDKPQIAKPLEGDCAGRAQLEIILTVKIF